MTETQDPATAAVALEHMTGLRRGALTWLAAGTLDVTLDPGCDIRVAEARPGEPGEDLVARLHRVGDTYEVEARGEGSVWVNGDRIRTARLGHGDTIEFGDTGPLCRARFFSDRGPIRNTVSDIISDIGTYLRVSRQPPLRRAMRAGKALFGRLSKETSLLFRITVLGALAAFALLAYQQWQLNKQVQESIARASAQLDSVAADLVTAQRDALHPSDLAVLRETIEQRMRLNVSRLEELEQHSVAAARVIARSSPAVAFLQGSYGFRESDGQRMLRHMVSAEGVPLISSRGWPRLALDGNGPVVEIQFTGTGFLVGEAGLLATNRHMALPWERTVGTLIPSIEGLEPVMIRFIAYLPGMPQAVPVALVQASERADLALVRPQDGLVTTTGLRLATQPPASGESVIVMGYPTGLKSMLAQSGPDFIRELEETENTGFWSVAERLAANGHIAPLSSRGIVGQVTPTTIVYDAETTQGGSGGPVLNTHGEVIAVNAVVLPEFGGSNIGVPAAELRALLRAATNP